MSQLKTDLIEKTHFHILCYIILTTYEHDLIGDLWGFNMCLRPDIHKWLFVAVWQVAISLERFDWLFYPQVFSQSQKMSTWSDYFLNKVTFYLENLKDLPILVNKSTFLHIEILSIFDSTQQKTKHTFLIFIQTHCVTIKYLNI